jgi:hypothetical protein
VSASIGIIWSLPFLFSGILGLALNKLSGRKMMCFLSKNVKISSLRTNDEPNGWVCGKWFIGYVHEFPSQQGALTKDLYLLITQKQLTELLRDKESSNPDDEQNKKIDFLEREGLFWNLTYPSRPIDLPDEKPWKSQETVVQQIVTDFIEKKYTTVLLAGKPGTGKSMIPLYVCKHLRNIYKKVSLVDTWNPTEPGDNFGAIYNKVNPSAQEPLVVVLEEVDGIILAMHRTDIKINTSVPMPIQVKTKTDWNQLLDRFDRKMYRGVILILTSNKTLNWFDELDPSYTRKGRINLHCVV